MELGMSRFKASGMLTAAVASALLLAGCAPAEEPKAAPSPSQSPVEQPSPVAEEGGNDTPVTDENAAERLEELRLTAGMTPEQIGQRYTEVISRWTMAGATPALHKEIFEGMLDDEALALDIAKENTTVYATALLGENYEATADSDLLFWVDKLEKINAQNIVNYTRSYSGPGYENPNTLNEETWHTEIEHLGVTVDSDNDSATEIVVRQKTHSNILKTMYRDSGSVTDGSISDTRITIDRSGDVPAITRVKVTDVK